MIKQNLILIGGGGHCNACIDVIEQEGKNHIVGVLDTKEKVDTEILGYEIIGTDEDIERFHQKGYSFLITVGQIKSASIRMKIFEKLQSINAKMATIISPTAYIAKEAKVGRGTIVMHKALVNTSTTVGDNCILNTGCVIEHNAKVRNHTHISTGAYINGDCVVGNNVFIGSNATICSQVNVCNNVVIGAGTVVNKHIIEPGTYVGNPAIKLK